MRELIIEGLQGRATPEEEQRLRQWRSEDPKNERSYQEVVRLWSLTGAAAPKMAVDDPPDVDVLIRRAEGEDATPLTRLPTGPRGGPWGWRAAIGSLVAASLVAVGFGIAALADGPDAGGLLAESEVVTGAGEMTTLTLADGSSIRIGPQSHLRLGRDEEGVVAHLDGRAFFGIQSNPSRTFTVRTDYGDARVLGTRFEVRSEDEEFRVLVVEGRVRVTAGGSAVDITERQMSRARAGAPQRTERIEDVYEHLAWMGNALVFQGTPLSAVAREIERRYGVEMILEDSELDQVTVTATFTGVTLEQVVLVVCEIVGARCSIDEDRVRMRRGPAGNGIGDRTG